MLLSPIVHNDRLILTTSQVAAGYGTDPQIITNNFNRNKTRYILGKHYYCLKGAEKRDFLNRHQIDLGSKNAKHLYLWTEHGALLHAKSLGTDKAWSVYEHLIETYFRVKENITQQQLPSTPIPLPPKPKYQFIFFTSFCSCPCGQFFYLPLDMYYI